MQKRLETVVRGSRDFPFQKYSFCGVRNGEMTTALHWHSEVEIIHVVCGEIEMRVESNAFLLKTGEICFVNPEELHSINVTKNDTTYNAFVFSPEILRFGGELFFNAEITDKIIGGLLKLPIKIEIDNPLQGEIMRNIKNLSRFADCGSSHRAVALAAIVSVFAQLYCGGAMNDAGNGDNVGDTECIRRCTDYLKRHYDERVTLKQLSDICYMSPNYFCAYFKKYTGITPFEQLSAIRINAAKKLLKGGEHSVTETALLCGFDSVGYFIRVFKKTTGVTPNVYKKSGGA